MNIVRGLINPVAGMRSIALTLLVVGVLCPLQAMAQVPPRFYWKSLSGGSAVPLIYETISGNTNPFDASHLVTPEASFEGTMALAGYAHTFTLFDRAAMAAVLVPMGRLSGDVTVEGNAASQSVSGFGDPTVEFNLNLIGPKAQKTLPDAVRYEPGFSLDVLVDLAIPVWAVSVVMVSAWPFSTASNTRAATWPRALNTGRSAWARPRSHRRSAA